MAVTGLRMSVLKVYRDFAAIGSKDQRPDVAPMAFHIGFTEPGFV